MAPILLSVAGLFLVVRFFGTSSPLQRKVVIAAWLIPGAGHLLLGERKRGLIVGGLIFATFLAGMALADFRNISPFDRHPIWGMAHAFGGLMAGVATLLTKSLLIYRDNAFYQAGCLYSGVAALLNILAMIDVWDLAGIADRKRPEGEPVVAEGASS